MSWCSDSASSSRDNKTQHTQRGTLFEPEDTNIMDIHHYLLQTNSNCNLQNLSLLVHPLVALQKDINTS